MTAVSRAPGSLDDVARGPGLRLEDLVDRDALQEVCRSFFALFGIAVRIYSQDGALVADAVQDQPVCKYLQGLRDARAACGATVAGVKGADPGEAGEATHPCFTGAVYRIIGIDYDGRRLGRVIVGPFLPADLKEMPRSLLAIDASIDPSKARELLVKMPRVRSETVLRIGRHLQSVLDLILFSGHRALLTSHMHLASVKESYRQLQEQNEKLTQSYERLRELDRLKSNFLATVSHELRTPLTSILGYSEMLTEGIGGELQPEQREFIATIREKGEQLLGLIKSLLDQSKLESGTLAFKMTSVAIEEVLDQVGSTLLPAAVKKGVAFEIEVEKRLPTIRGDADRLRQVFLNLAENALKFTPRGGSVRLVAHADTSTSEPEDDVGYVLFAQRPAAVIVRVEDTGIGIPEGESARIFDAFYQVDGSSTREHGGAGLGLSIVKRLVEMHGGTIAVEPNRDPPRPVADRQGRRMPGTVFTVRIPLG